MNKAFLVALIRVIVAGEQIAVLGEQKTLGIAQTNRKNFQPGAIGIAAKHRAHIRNGDHAALLCFHVSAAITAAKIELSVRAKDETVEIVARVIETHAVAAA